MRKILHLIPNLGTGGTEKILLEICKKFHPHTFEMGVVSLKSGGPTAEALKNLGVPVTLLKSPDSFGAGLLDFPRLFFKLRKIILNFSPDLIHTWLTRANMMGRLAAHSLGLKNVLSSIRVMEMEKSYHLWAERITHSFCRAVTVNATELKKFTIEKIRIPEEKVILIFNGVELPSMDALHPMSFPPRRESISSGFRVVARNDSLLYGQDEKEKVRIGTLGRLHRQKGVDIFLQAAQIVLRKFPQTVFVVGGEGKERPALEKLATQMQISPQVHFTGEISNPAEFLCSLDIFVLASRWEGMPNVVLEAMANGVPVVASRVGGVTDLIEDGTSGILTEKENPVSCAEGILLLVADAALRKKVVENAFERVKEKFSLNAMLASYQKLYDFLTMEKNLSWYSLNRA